MWVAEAIPPAGPVVTLALGGLFILAAVFVAIGMVKLVDAISRAFFGTLSGAVAWIPYAGKVAAHSLHKVEQKISHGLGSAERTLDGYAAWTWHNMAALVRYVAHEVTGGAVTVWHLAQQARAFVMHRDMRHAIRRATKPLKATEAQLKSDALTREAQVRALNKSVAQGVYPRLKAGEVYDRTVVRPNVKTARAEAKAAEAQAIHLFRWLSRHRLGVLAAVFTGAVAFTLNRLGGGWIRCRNWRTIGKHVCRWPFSLIEALLGLGLAFAVVIDPRKTAEAAVVVEDAMESLIRKIAD